MAGPSLEEWILQLDLRMVQDPSLSKPVYRKNYPGGITLSEQLDKRIGSGLRQARLRKKLSGLKISTLLGVTDQIYYGYETATSRLTVGRFLHICEVLGVPPEQILIPATPGAWGVTEEATKICIMIIDKIRRLDAKTLAPIYKLINAIPDEGPKAGSDAGDEASFPVESSQELGDQARKRA